MCTRPAFTAAPEQASRRDALRLGLLGGLGLTLPELWNRRLHAAESPTPPLGTARSCILLFMYGGPAHQDIWDMKPHGSTDARGAFQPISTSVPGIQVGEHIPYLAQQAHRYAIVRSVTHEDSVHETAFYTMVTGRARDPQLGFAARPTDHPHMGSVVSHLKNSPTPLSPFATNRPTLENGGGEQHYPGLGAGFLGSGFEPTSLYNPKIHQPRGGFTGLSLPPDIDRERFRQRLQLLESTNGSRLSTPSQDIALPTHQARATELLTSSAARRALRIEEEPDRMRQRYGMTQYGQNLLLARRLVEAGVSLITVYYNLMIPRLPINNQPLWDTHKRNFMYLKDHLLPSVDQPISVLLDDLDERGLLDETLVVWSSEFGRTPGINRDGGRDHWPGANSLVMAGGGIAGGQVYGATDKQAAYPSRDAVTPGQVTATIFSALGIDPTTQIRDPLQRPHHIADGSPLISLFGQRPA